MTLIQVGVVQLGVVQLGLVQMGVDPAMTGVLRIYNTQTKINIKPTNPNKFNLTKINVD